MEPYAGSLTAIGAHALEGCASLQSVTFGTALETIGFAALRDCGELMTLTIPFAGGSKEENRFLGFLFGADSPALAEGFYPPFLREITVLPGCSSLADQAFTDCAALQSISLPADLISIGARTFSGCGSLALISTYRFSPSERKPALVAASAGIGSCSFEKVFLKLET